MDSGAIIPLGAMSIILSIISIILDQVNFDDEIKIKENKFKRQEQHQNNIEKIIYYILRRLRPITITENDNNNNNDDDDEEVIIFDIDDDVGGGRNIRNVRRDSLSELRKEIMIKYNKAKKGLLVSILFALVFVLCFHEKYDYVVITFTWVPLIAFSVIFLARDIIRFRFLLEEDFFSIIDAAGISSSSSHPSPPPPPTRISSFIKRIFKPNFAYSLVGNEGQEQSINASKTFNTIFVLYIIMIFVVDVVYFILIQQFGIAHYEKYGFKITLILLQIIIVQMIFSTLIHGIDNRLNAYAIVKTFVENFTFVMISALPFLVSGKKIDLLIMFNCIILPAFIHIIRLVNLIPYYKSTKNDTLLIPLTKTLTKKEKQEQRIASFILQEKGRHIHFSNFKQSTDEDSSDIAFEYVSYISYDITKSLFDEFFNTNNLDKENIIVVPNDILELTYLKMIKLGNEKDFGGDDDKKLLILIDGKYYINDSKNDPLKSLLEYLLTLQNVNLKEKI